MGAPDLQVSQLNPIEAHAFPASSLEEELAQATKSRPDLAAMERPNKRKPNRSAPPAPTSVRASAPMATGKRTANRSRAREATVGSRASKSVLTFSPRQTRSACARKRRQTAYRRPDGTIALAGPARREPRAHSTRDAGLSLETAQAARSQSAESLRIVRNRYNAGLATITDLLRAEDAERESQSNYWRAVYGNAMAYTQLLFARDTTPDAAEELQ